MLIMILQQQRAVVLGTRMQCCPALHASLMSDCCCCGCCSQTAEFMGSDPFMALLGLRMSLIAYPVVALSRVSSCHCFPVVLHMLSNSCFIVITIMLLSSHVVQQLHMEAYLPHSVRYVMCLAPLHLDMHQPLLCGCFGCFRAPAGISGRCTSAAAGSTRCIQGHAMTP
jgi:hypothetical protein